MRGLCRGQGGLPAAALHREVLTLLCSPQPWPQLENSPGGWGTRLQCSAAAPTSPPQTYPAQAATPSLGTGDARGALRLCWQPKWDRSLAHGAAWHSTSPESWSRQLAEGHRQPSATSLHAPGAGSEQPLWRGCPFFQQHQCLEKSQPKPLRSAVSSRRVSGPRSRIPGARSPRTPRRAPARGARQEPERRHGPSSSALRSPSYAHISRGPVLGLCSRLHPALTQAKPPQHPCKSHLHAGGAESCPEQQLPPSPTPTHQGGVKGTHTWC